MTSTLGFTGMDRNTQAELTQAFSQAVGRLGLDLRLVENGEADIVVVDMDSLYGPMSWMQLHNAGRKVIGYTSSPRTQTDYRLDRPADANALDALLKELGIGTAQAPKPVVAPAAEAAKPAAPATKPAPASKPAAATPHGLTPAPAPADVLPEEAPSPAPAEVLATPAIQPEPLPAPVPAGVRVGWRAWPALRPGPARALLPAAHRPVRARASGRAVWRRRAWMQARASLRARRVSLLRRRARPPAWAPARCRCPVPSRGRRARWHRPGGPAGSRSGCAGTRCSR